MKTRYGIALGVLLFVVLAASRVRAESLEAGLVEAGRLTGVESVTKSEYCPEHDLLFLMSGSDVRILRGATGEVIETHAATETFTDMDLTRDGGYLFVADYGGERTGYGTPLTTHYVHRYDLQAGQWITAAAPSIAWKIEAVSSDRVLLQEHDQWIDITLNSFGTAMAELSRIRADYYGDMEYDPDTARVYHGNSGSSSREIDVLTVAGDTLVAGESTGVYGTAQSGGGTCSLSTDGTRLYYGKLQVDAMNVKSNLYTFPENIYAAWPKIAFGKESYYSAETGALLASWGFTCGAVDVSEDGKHVWAHDADAETMIHYIDSSLLTLNLPVDGTEGDGLLSAFGSVSVVTAPESNLVVTLMVSDPEEVDVPESVILPAGETNVMFEIVILDDAQLDGSQYVTISATPAYGAYPTDEAVIIVHDSESAALTLSLPQTTFEGAGSIAGAVQVSVPPVKDVVIQLVSNNAGAIGSGSVVIPAGQTFAAFSLPVVDDSKLDGVQTATITAHVENWQSAQASVFVWDNETTGIELQLPAALMEGDGVLTNGGFAVLSATAVADVQVLLTCSDAGELSVPAYVTIPAGTNQVAFDLAVIDDVEMDGTTTVSVVARAPGYVPAGANVSIVDNDLHHLLVAGVTNVSLSGSAEITVSAVTIDDTLIQSYTNTVTLSASGDRGDVAITPDTLTNMVGGVARATVSFDSIGDDVTLTATSGSITGTSALFNVEGARMLITPSGLTNTLVVAGESLVRTLVISNAGNVDLEFEIQGVTDRVAEPEESDPTLVAYYPFNGDASDESGNGYDGTVSGAALTADRFGNPASAYDFNGTSDYINCGNILNGFSNFTVSAWINIDTYTHSTYMGPWSQKSFSYPGGIGEYGFVTANGSVSSFGTSMRWADGTVMDSRTNYTVSANEWHLITQTYDGNTVRQYDNGVLINSTESSGHTISNTWDFLIGKFCGYPGYLVTTYFDGQIDDLRIYKRALSDSEIQTLVAEDDSSDALDAGLVAAYSFSGDAKDESGNGYDGTVSGAALTTNRFGEADSAYYFDGVDDRIDLPSAPLNFERTNSFSQSLWIKTSDDDTGNIILAKMASDSSYRGWCLAMNNGLLSTYLMSSGTAQNRVRVDGTTWINDNQWHHLVVTYDGSSLASGVVVYIDGGLEDSVIAADTLTGTILNSVTPTIGSRSSESYYEGSIDDIRVYGRTLSAAEVQVLYAEADAADEDIDLDSGLVASYSFSGDATDESGNGNDGIMEGATLTEDRFGNPDQACRFDVGNYIRTASGTGSIDITGVITMAAWINPEQFEQKSSDPGMLRTILRKMSQYNSYGYSFSVNAAGKLVVAFGNSSDANVSRVADNMDPLTTNEWTHVAATYDGSQILFYVNGVLVDTQAYTKSLLSTSEALCIGRLTDSDSRAFFYGGMDEVYLYDRVLSETEVHALYVQGGDSGNDGFVVESPAVYYPANGDAADESGNGNDGIVEGATLMEDRFGNPEQAYRFDVGSYIRTASGTGSTDITGVITMAAWINPEQFERKSSDPGVVRTILRKRSISNSYGYTLGVTASGQLTVAFGHNSVSGTANAASNMSGLPTNEWSHVVATYDGAQILYYVNGVLVDTQAYSNILGSTTEALCIGRLSDSSAQAYFYGGIDEVYLFDRVLSAAEVQALYADDGEGGEGGEEPEVSWLTADPVSGTVPPGSSVTVAVTLDAAGMAVGDSASAVLSILSNDPAAPTNACDVSMYVVPPAPAMSAEPETTDGVANTVFWSAVEGPVSYWVEVATATNAAALQASDWIAATHYTFASLEAGTIYYYRVCASIDSDIGRLSGPWSGWVWSAQGAVPGDADGDHIPDWWETQYFGVAGVLDPDADSDGDGQSDYNEYVAGMNPTNPASCFMVNDAYAPTNGQFVICWDAVTGRVYSIEWASATTNTFAPIATDLAYPQNSYTDTLHQAEDCGFYKVEVEIK